MDTGVARLWSQGGRRGLQGTEFPQRGPGAVARWRSEGETLRSQIYTDSLQTSNTFLRRFVAEPVLYLPYAPLSQVCGCDSASSI